jgi:hypothetical protein
MDVKVGDILVFKGDERTIKLNSHYKNFKFGEKYKVSDISSLQYDIDTFTVDESTFVTFENTNYGSLMMYLDIYFNKLEDQRDEKLNKIFKI